MAQKEVSELRTFAPFFFVSHSSMIETGIELKYPRKVFSKEARTTGTCKLHVLNHRSSQWTRIFRHISIYMYPLWASLNYHINGYTIQIPKGQCFNINNPKRSQTGTLLDIFACESNTSYNGGQKLEE